MTTKRLGNRNTLAPSHNFGGRTGTPGGLLSRRHAASRVAAAWPAARAGSIWLRRRAHTLPSRGSHGYPAAWPARIAHDRNVEPRKGPYRPLENFRTWVPDVSAISFLFFFGARPASCTVSPCRRAGLVWLEAVTSQENILITSFPFRKGFFA